MYRHLGPRGLLVLFAILLTSCGGGGGPSTPAPSGLSYPVPPAFVINQTITPLAPTVTGQVTSYSVSPAFPAGLFLNSFTGVISGTPTVTAAMATYTVTATNAGGSTATSVSIVVNEAAPSIQYGSSYFAFAANVKGATPAPAVSGGNVVTWSVSPGLPAGLELSQTDGTISGTPTAASAATTYVVTATNSAGQSTASLAIAVTAAPLLDLGHASTVDVMRFVNSRVLSRDTNGHWILQDFTSGTTLASGDSPCSPASTPLNCVLEPIDLAGSVLIDGTTTGLEVRDSSDGHLLSTIPGQPSWWLLASDGSYIAAGSTTGLIAWSPTGQALLSHSGDYSTAMAFAAPGQINVALGAAGQSVIESISLTSGTSSLSPSFQGQFTLWFIDGGRFLTAQGSTVRTYSAAGIQQDVTQLPGLIAPPPAPSLNLAGGQGNWFWTIDGIFRLNLYQVGSSASPALTASLPAFKVIPSGTTIGVLPYSDSGQVEVIDLSGATPVSTTYAVPLAYPSAYAAMSGTTWVAASYDGVVLDGTSLTAQPRYLTPGSAKSIVGGTQYFSIATASGKILFYDGSTNNLLGTIDFPAFQMSASSDGTVLAAISSSSDSNNVPSVTVNIYSLPSGTLINSFPPTSTQSPRGILLSGSGNVLAEVLSSTSTPCYGQAIPVMGGTPLWCAPATVALAQVSPDGTLIASAASQFQTSTSTTSLYKNGSLVATVPGTPVGWLDNTRLLAVIFKNVMLVGGGTADVFQNAVIYDSLGNNQGATPIIDIQAAQPITTDTIYSPDRNAIMSLTTGAVSWMSADSNEGICSNEIYSGASDVCFGALSGSEVIFASGVSVLAQPY